jgi:D-3-phosphoglycerate dehydrogenase / 2-oxoglutarate reductase
VRAISRNGTGVDSIDRETAIEKGLVVMNCPGGNAQAVAEVKRSRR